MKETHHSNSRATNMVAVLTSLVVLLTGLSREAFSFSLPHRPQNRLSSEVLSRLSRTSSPPTRTKRIKLQSSTSTEPVSRLGVTKGDTKGANLLLTNLNISTGAGNPILKSINFRVDPKERWGVVGPNGCGKSTLLGAITGTVRVDEGQALVASKVRVGYLKQTAVSGSTKTVREEAASEMDEINSAKSLLKMLETQISNGDASEKTLNDLANAQSRFADVGGWTQEQDVDLVLKGLGFQPSDSDRLCSDFSGGWQMRIALARLLLSQPDLLLLDEPSNHLDSSARDWLATYLSNYQGSILLVSHDVPLLSKAVNNIAEVSGQTLIQYVSCSYEKYLSEKDFRAKSAMAEYERNVKEAARLQGRIATFLSPLYIIIHLCSQSCRLLRIRIRRQIRRVGNEGSERPESREDDRKNEKRGKAGSTPFKRRREKMETISDLASSTEEYGREVARFGGGRYWLRRRFTTNSQANRFGSEMWNEAYSSRSKRCGKINLTSCASRKVTTALRKAD